MGSMSDRSRWGRRIFIAVVLLLATTGALDEDELWCEEAIGHIRDCCPDLDVTNICGDADGYCTPVITLSRDESECILELECGPEAVAVCERLEVLQDSVAHEELVEPPSEVCR